MADTKNRRTVGRATAHRSESQGKVWWVVSVDGKQVATVPGDQFARDGQRMLETYNAADGVFLPEEAEVPVRPDLALQHGRDATLRVDEWTREQAADEYREEGLYAHAVSSRILEQWPTFERELFASLYGEPEELPQDERAVGSDWMRQVFDQARGLPEWDVLRTQARNDAWASGMAASRLTDVLSEALDKALAQLPAEDPQRLQEEAETLEAIAGGQESARVQAAQQAAADAVNQAERVALELGSEPTERKLRGVLRQAISDVAGEIVEVNGGISVIGGGPGQIGACQAPRGEIRRALQSNPRLRSIANIAGRLKVAARQKQRTKTRYVPEQVVDVELGNELLRLLPSEVMLLASEETELVLYRRLLERQAQQYRLDGTEQRARGPVVLCVDGSGSMQGLRHEWAMGVALALLELCVAQKRGFALVHFDAQVQRVVTVPKPEKLTLPKLLEMVMYFSGGGTRFTPPMVAARKLIESDGLKDADVILLTDGANEDQAWLSAVVDLKTAGAATYGVSIGGEFAEAYLKELAGVARVSADMRDTAEIDLVFGI